MSPPKADFVYIGYPKAASTFVGRFFSQHPQVSTDRMLLHPLYAPSMADVSPASAEKPDPTKVHVSINEKVAESICVVGNRDTWNTYKFIPNASDKLTGDILLDPTEAARRVKQAYPSARVLMMLREQVDWLHSSYKFFMPRMPARQRSFADFCATPRGVAYLAAGHYDRTIEAYVATFGADRVMVLRFEDIRRAPQRLMTQLCTYLGIAEQPLPESPANEGSSAQVSRIRRLAPVIDSLPAGVRTAGKALLSLLPVSNAIMLSESEIGMLRNKYAESNEKTEKLIAGLKH